MIGWRPERILRLKKLLVADPGKEALARSVKIGQRRDDLGARVRVTDREPSVSRGSEHAI